MRHAASSSIRTIGALKKAMIARFVPCVLSLLTLVWGSFPACADSGVIIPSDRQSPDASEISISSLNVKIIIDNGHATVRLQEVFRNKTDKVLEGTYAIALPGDAAVSDFAVWDDLTRIPGVILERKRASELYNQIRNEAIDPALIESGEVTETNAEGAARHSSEFTVRIVPIPANGYKRIETEYRQTIPVDKLSSGFVLPLRPTSYAPQTVERLTVSLELRSPFTLTDFESLSKTFPLKTESHDAHSISTSFEGVDFILNDDLAISYKVQNEQHPRIQAYRTGEIREAGYFEASALLQTRDPTTSASARTVLVLFDTSLSMQWEKLERSFQALETTLRSLRPVDRFNVIAFNSEVALSNPQPVAATAAAVASALDFVRASRLKGGTNLQQAIASALKQATQNTYVVLLSDGEMTEGIVSSTRFFPWFDKAWNSTTADRRPHIYALGIGDDANLRLMRRLASHAGVYEQVRSTEPLDFKLGAFIRKIGLTPLNAVTLNVSARAKADLIYRQGESDFPGSLAGWVGQYHHPGDAEFTVVSTANSATSRQSTKATLPQSDTSHAYLPAAWGRARVDALLEKIDREGEDKASIEEIIRLARKYKFVTPYTSFLAAPRALLRPRLIRPGDPILRVRTDASIRSVIGLFPFGLTKALRYLKSEDMWQTRFLVPDDMKDGVYPVRLILRDREGRVYREQKTFVISSEPPIVRIHLERSRVHAGDRLSLRVEASATTRHITARLYGANPLSLHWDENAKSNTGVLIVPAALPAGRYAIHVTAEDIAHNISHQEAPLEVVP